METYEYKGRDGKVFNLPVEFKDEFNSRISIAEEKVKKSMEDQIGEIKGSHVKEIETFKKTLKEKDDLLATKLTDDEKHQKEESDRINALKTTEAQRDTFKNVLINRGVNDQIMMALEGKVKNPRQSILVFRDKFGVKGDFNPESADQVKLEISKDGKAIGLEEAVKMYLEDPDNEYQVISGYRSGAGSESRKGQRKDSAVYNLKDWQNEVSSADPVKRKELLRKKAAGEIVIKD